MATRRTLDSIPPGWIEYEADLTPVAACDDGVELTDPAEIAAFCNAAWARDADYREARRVIGEVAPQVDLDVDVSRQDVNGVVELSVGVFDIAPIREAVGAVIPESRLKVF